MGEIGGHNAGSSGLSALLSWQNLVFLLPFGASIFLLLLSSFRLGGGHRHAGGGFKGHAGGGHGRHHHSGGVGKGHAKTAAGKAHGKPGAKHNNGSSKNHVTPLGFVIALVGANRAPLPLLAQIFCLAWGVGGLAAGRLLPGGEPSGAGESSLRFLFCLLAAFAFGFVAARLGAELLARFMPQESTSVVSRDALYGLTGKVIFPVTASAGRVRVYDEWNTLHDESCRRAGANSDDDAAPIAKGRTVRIVDRDAKGCLLVEEA